MQQRVVWQTEDGKIYIGFIVLGYPVPVQEFKTLSEFMAYVQRYQAELIMYYEFIEEIFSHNVPNSIKSFINSLEIIDSIK